MEISYPLKYSIKKTFYIRIASSVSSYSQMIYLDGSPPIVLHDQVPVEIRAQKLILRDFPPKSVHGVGDREQNAIGTQVERLRNALAIQWGPRRNER